MRRGKKKSLLHSLFLRQKLFNLFALLLLIISLPVSIVLTQRPTQTKQLAYIPIPTGYTINNTPAQRVRYGCSANGACILSATGLYADPNCGGQCSPPAVSGGGSSANSSPDECYHAGCGSGTYCGGACGVTGNVDNLYTCVCNATGNCSRSNIRYCGAGKCQRNIMGGDICQGSSSSSGTAQPTACENNGGVCLNQGNISVQTCPNGGAVLSYSCNAVPSQQSGGICCSQGGYLGPNNSGGGNVTGGTECGSATGSCLGQPCASGATACEDNSATCTNGQENITVYQCISGKWGNPQKKTGGSKCYGNTCAPNHNQPGWACTKGACKNTSTGQIDNTNAKCGGQCLTAVLSTRKCTCDNNGYGGNTLSH